MAETVKTYPENLLYIILQSLNEMPAEENMLTAEVNFRNILQSLPKVDRTILKLRFNEGKSYYMIGRTTGFTQEYVKYRIKNVIRRLKTEYIGEILPTQGQIL